MTAKLTLEAAQSVCEAMLADAAGRGLRFAAAVVDAGGETVCLLRMDGASALTARMCANKAYTAVKWGRDTKVLNENLFGMAVGDDRREIGWFGDSRFTPVLGGIVLTAADGTLLGALGGSGGSPQQDEDIGRVGQAAFAAL